MLVCLIALYNTFFEMTQPESSRFVFSMRGPNEDLNQFISALFSCIAQSNKTGDLTSLIRLHLEQSVVVSVYRRILVGTWLVRDSREEA